MAKAKQRLKVYRTTAGFYETVVAAPNQAEALRVWGVRQNLFAEGAADVVEDPEVVKAATATPGQPLRRPVGSKDAYEADPTALPSVPDAPERKAEAKASRSKPAPKPDRQPLEAAEKRLEAHDEAFEQVKAEIDEKRRALDEERDAAEDRWRSERKPLMKALETAERTYRRAGGEG